MEDTSGITVVGRGERRYAPDALVVSLGTRVLRPALVAARDEAAAATGRILAVLAAGGVEDRHVQTEQLSVQAEWDHRGTRPIRTGYRVTSTAQVRFEDLAAAPVLLDQVVEVGGEDVTLDDLRFVLDPTPARQAEVRALAWDDALAKATQLADLAGAGLGPALEIVELAGHEPPGPRPMARMAMAMAEAAPMPVAEGELVLTLGLRVRFAFD
jgi:uncharacterized protein